MIGHIDENGNYVEGKNLMPHDVSSQYKSWNHDDQKHRFAVDIVQPFVDGKPNPEFVSVYRGDVANRYFNQEQVDKADRNLGGLQ